MAKFTQQTITRFLSELGSDRPTPGGGSAAALAGALGVAQLLMVARFSAPKLKSASEKNPAKRLIKVLVKLQPQMTRIIDEDAKVYGKVSTCYVAIRRAGSAGKKRAARIMMDQALNRSFQVQAKLAFLSLMSLRVLDELKPLASGSIKSDVTVARSLLRAAFEGAFVTCEVNWKYVEDRKRKNQLGRELVRLKREFKTV